ncbi:MAG: Glycerone kinase [Proteobacteria bacterium]|nr:Glycerone kinase [Pseudomonadota bacterium]
MTHICNNPEEFAASALLGFCSIYPHTVRPVSGGVVRATASPEHKVAVVVGGGSGHYPAFAGMVGPGLADAAVAGDIFASPSTHAIAHVCRLAHRGGGILLGFGKYAGDVLNFGLAAERLISEGIDVRVLPVTDDVASAPIDKPSQRRGVAGDLMVFKIAGAAAEAGLRLDEVERVAIKANQNTVSFGVAFSGCTLPGAKEPLFTVPSQHMGIGLGIHGEPGISEDAILSADGLAQLLAARLLAEKPANAGGRVAVVVNGLGATKYEELFVLWRGIEPLIRQAGLTIVAPEAGEFVTSLDMAGCSLTFTWLDEELEKYWCAPADAIGFRRGATIPTTPAPALVETIAEQSYGPSSPESCESGKCIAYAIDRVAAALRDAEDELGRIDALAGDGDHGQGMTRGSAAAAEAATKAVAAGAGAATVLSAAGNAWADRAGGASGALWGLALRSWSSALNDDVPATPIALASGAKLALEAIMRLGGAQVGDKTLVDSFVPFVETLGDEIAQGRALSYAWREAAGAATKAAEATAQLTPKLGRARSHAARSLGHPDAGAVSLALCARVVADAMVSFPQQGR